MGHKDSPILSFRKIGISDNFYSTKYMTQSTYPSFSGTDELLYVSYCLVRGKSWYSGVTSTAPNLYQINVKMCRGSKGGLYPPILRVPFFLI